MTFLYVVSVRVTLGLLGFVYSVWSKLARVQLELRLAPHHG